MRYTAVFTFKDGTKKEVEYPEAVKGLRKMSERPYGLVFTGDMPCKENELVNSLKVERWKVMMALAINK